MQTKLLVMRPDQPHETMTVELPKEPSYVTLRDLLKPILNCDWPEHVSVLADFAGGTNYQRADMFVDELGHQKRLMRNEAATTIYRRNAMILHQVTDAESLSFIVGPAVLFDRVVWT